MGTSEGAEGSQQQQQWHDGLLALQTWREHIMQAPTLTSLTPLELKQLSKWSKVELLRQYRSGRMRNATTVLLLGADLLAGSTSGISSAELYNIYEQVVVASLECGRTDAARSYLEVLQKRFGQKSVRVSHLRGLCLEAEGKSREARELYKSILKNTPTDPFAVQRTSAMLKSEGLYREAIRVLETAAVYTDDTGDENVSHTFTEVHTESVPDVYKELSYLYGAVGDFDKAAYYAEEMVLFEPTNYLAHLRVAELMYTLGELERSAASYAQSLRLNCSPNNTRAAYGLLIASGELLRQYKKQQQSARSGGDGNSVEERRAAALRAWSESKLKTLYAGNPMLSVVEGMLQKC